MVVETNSSLDSQSWKSSHPYKGVGREIDVKVEPRMCHVRTPFGGDVEAPAIYRPLKLRAWPSHVDGISL